MMAYLVGGAVRDTLLGRPVADKDWVVVGSTPEAMAQAGFKSVGADFQVHHHPKTGEEYALARSQRGTPVDSSRHVTLEEDLSRRDLTINAMAMDPAGQIIDPFGGQADLQQGILRHVSTAFAEDPIRVLRLARFAARYQGFRVAEETRLLCQQLAEQGALDNLAPERVWKELSRGLMENHPSVMVKVLRECGALRRVLPELDNLAGVPQTEVHHPEVDTLVHVLMALDVAAARKAPLEVRYAVLLHDLGKGLTRAEFLPSHYRHEDAGVPLVRKISSRLRVPSSIGHIAEVTCAGHTLVHQASKLRSGTIVRLLGRLDVLRRPERLEWFLEACECDSRGRLGFLDRPYPQAGLVRQAAEAMRTIDAGAIAKSCDDPRLIPERLYLARLEAVTAALL
jgi:tRNA nucleotidyltransferase (CCA-adding enzyme)